MKATTARIARLLAPPVQTLAAILAVSAIASTAQAADNYQYLWTNDAGNSLYADSANWSESSDYTRTHRWIGSGQITEGMSELEIKFGSTIFDSTAEDGMDPHELHVNTGGSTVPVVFTAEADGGLKCKTFNVGTFWDAGATVEMRSGTYTFYDDIALGWDAPCSGTLKIAGAGVYCQNWLHTGRGGGYGKLEVSSGSLTTGVDRKTDGKLALAEKESGNADMIVSGTGVVLVQGVLAAPAGSSGTVNVTMDGGTMTVTEGVELGNSANGTGNLAINGGTLTTTQVRNPAGTGTVAFNGGTLAVSTSATDDNKSAFIASGLAVTVGEKGGTIDTAGQDITINARIDGDGTLTVTGGGKVTFTHAVACNVTAADDTTVEYSVTRESVSVTDAATGDASTITALVKGAVSESYSVYGTDALDSRTDTEDGSYYAAKVTVADEASDVTIAGVGTTGAVSADVYTVVAGGTAANVIGGSDTTSAAATITGNLHTELTGGAVTHVFGAGQGGYSGAKVSGDVDVVIGGNATVKGSVLGAWDVTNQYWSNSSPATVEGDTHVLVQSVQSTNDGQLGDTRDRGNGYYIAGGGAGHGSYTTSRGTVTGNTSVKIDLPNNATGDFVKTIVGGSVQLKNHSGEYGTSVSGNTSVEISAPDTVTFTADIFGGCMSVYNGSSTVGGASTVTVNGGTYTGTLYAGCNPGTSASATLTLNKGVFKGGLSGGGATTRTLHIASANDVDLTGLASIANFDAVTFGEGVAVEIPATLESAFNQCGAATYTENDKVYATAVKENKWTGTANDGLWTTKENWSLEAVPNKTNYAVFDTEAEVTIGDAPEILGLVVDAATTLSGGTITTSGISGEGAITLGDDATIKAAASRVSFSNPLVITASAEKPAVFTSDTAGNAFTVAGAITGTGYVKFTNEAGNVENKLSGNNGDFAGTIEVANQSGTFLTAANASSAKAKWIVSCASVNMNFGASSITLQFGTLTGTIRDNVTSGHYTTTYEVGALATADETMELAYIGSSGNNDRCGIIRMVGAGTLKMGSATSNVKGYELNAGTVEFTANGCIPNNSKVKFNGGTLKLDDAVTSDPSAKLEFVADTTAVIDGGTIERTFATPIGNSTSASLVKKGEGTITLAVQTVTTETTYVKDEEGNDTEEVETEGTTTYYYPTYTGATTVKEGALIVPSAFGYTLGANTEKDSTYAEEGYDKLVHFTVAKVGDEEFDTIAEAMAALDGSNDTVTLVHSTAEVVTLAAVGSALKIVKGEYTFGGVTTPAGIAVSETSEGDTTIYTAVDNGNATWTGEAGDGKWQTPGNWSTGYTPDSGTSVTFPATVGELTVGIPSNAPVAKNITVGEGATVTIVNEDATDGSNWATLNLYGDLGGGGTLRFLGSGFKPNTGTTVGTPVVLEGNGSIDAFIETSDYMLTFVAPLTLKTYAKVKSASLFHQPVTIAEGADVRAEKSMTFNGTLDVGAGAVYTANTGAAPAFGDNASLTGTGRIVYGNNVPGANGQKVLKNTNWKGTVEFRGTTINGFNPGNFGNTGSTVCFNGASGYLQGAENDTITYNTLKAIEIGANGLTLNAQYTTSGRVPTSYIINSPLTGSGTIVFGTKDTVADHKMYYFFNGDASGFTGAINFGDLTTDNAGVVYFKNGTVSMGGEDATGKGQILVHSTATVNVGATWTAPGGIIVNGEAKLTTADAQLSNSVTGSGIVRMGVSSTYIKVPAFGEGSQNTLVLDGMTAGYIRATASAAAPNITVPVRLDGNVKITNGYGATSTDASVTTFAVLSGTGDLEINFDTSATYFNYAITKVDAASYTGTIKIGHSDDTLKIGTVDVESVPTDGTRVVALTKSAGKLYNASAEEVTTDNGKVIAMTEEGEESSAKLFLGTDGLYVAVASVTVTTPAEEEGGEPTTTTTYYASLEDAVAAATEAGVDSFTRLYGTGTVPGWYAEEGSSVFTKSTTVKVDVDGVGYETIAAAGDARTATSVITLFADNTEAVTLAAGETLNVNGNAYTGTLSGSGTIIVDVAPTTAPTFSTDEANPWTGTFVMGWAVENTTAAEFYPGDYGVSGSTLKIAGGLQNVYLAVKNAQGSAIYGTIAPALYLAADVTLKNGWGEVSQRTTIPELGADAGATFTTRTDYNQGKSVTHFLVNKLRNFAGDLVLSDYTAFGFDGLYLSETPAFGAKVLNATLSGSDQTGIFTNLASAVVYVNDAATELKLVQDADGLYVAAAKAGDGYYKTVAAAIAAAEAANITTVTVLDGSSEEFDNWTFDSDTNTYTYNTPKVAYIQSGRDDYTYFESLADALADARAALNGVHLSSDITLTDALTVSSSAMLIGESKTITGNITIAAGGVLQPSALTINGDVTVAGALSVPAATVTITGGLTVNGGTVQIGSVGTETASLAVTGAVALNGDVSIVVNSIASIAAGNTYKLVAGSSVTLGEGATIAVKDTSGNAVEGAVFAVADNTLTLQVKAAKVGDEYYDTFDLAKTAANGTETIELLLNVSSITQETDGDEHYHYVTNGLVTVTSGETLKVKKNGFTIYVDLDDTAKTAGYTLTETTADEVTTYTAAFFPAGYGDANYATIQAAIDAAKADAEATGTKVVTVKAGTYTEALDVAEDLTLKLAGDTTVASVAIADGKTLTLAADAAAKFTVNGTVDNDNGIVVGKVSGETETLVVGANVTLVARIVKVGCVDGAIGVLEVAANGALSGTWVKAGQAGGTGTIKVAGSFTASDEGQFGAKGTLEVVAGGSVEIKAGPAFDAGSKIVVAPDATTAPITIGPTVTVNSAIEVASDTTLEDGTTYKVLEVIGEDATLTSNATAPDGYVLNVADNTLTIALSPYVAQVGEKKFRSLQEAIDEADGAAVTLLVTGEAATITADVKIAKGEFDCAISGPNAVEWEVTSAEDESDATVTVYTLGKKACTYIWAGEAGAEWDDATSWTCYSNAEKPATRAPDALVDNSIEIKSDAKIALAADLTFKNPVKTVGDIKLELVKSEKAEDDVTVSYDGGVVVGKTSERVFGEGVKVVSTSYSQVSGPLTVAGEYDAGANDIAINTDTSSTAGSLTVKSTATVKGNNLTIPQAGATTGSVTIESGATVTMSSNITLAEGATLTLAAVTGEPLITAGGNVTLNGTVVVTGAEADGTYKLLTATGTITIGETAKCDQGDLSVKDGALILTVGSVTPAKVSIEAATITYDVNNKAKISAKVTADEGGTVPTTGYTLKIGDATYTGAYDSATGTVTFDVTVPDTVGTAYDYTISVGETTSSGSTYVGQGEASAWFSTKPGNTTGGEWDSTATIGDYEITVSDSTFAPEAAAKGEIVTITIEGSFGGVNAEAIDTTGAKAAVRIGTKTVGESSVETFQVLVNGEWVSVGNEALGVNSETEYTVVLTLNYATKLYTVTIGGYVVADDEGNTAFALPEEAVSAVKFEGAGTIQSLVGEYYDVYAAEVEGGAKYDTVAAAAQALADGTETGTVKVYHTAGAPDYVTIGDDGVLTLKSYTVTFDADEGSEVDSQSVTYGKTANKPEDPTKTGYTFGAWYQVTDGTVAEEAYDFATKVTGDIELKATWTINSYTVTFDSDGGSTVEEQTVEYNKTATKPETDPTKDGYTFKGWTLDGEAYNFDTPVTAAITLTAKWEVITYTVTFDSDGGSAVESQTVEYNKTATEPTAPTKDGYTFTGWTLNGAEYDFTAAVTGDITLKATWEENQTDTGVEVKTDTGSDFKLQPSTVTAIQSLFDGVTDTASDAFKAAAESYVLGLYTEEDGKATATEMPTPYIEVDADGKVTVYYGDDEWKNVKSGYTVTSYLVASDDLTKVGDGFKAGDENTYVAKATLGEELEDTNEAKADKRFYKVIVVITGDGDNDINVYEDPADEGGDAW